MLATLSLGLGVGVNTTLYSVFRTVFLVSPTSIAPGRLVRIEPGNSNQIAYPNYRDIRPGDTFEGLAAYARVALNLRVSGEVGKSAQGWSRRSSSQCLEYSRRWGGRSLHRKSESQC